VQINFCIQCSSIPIFPLEDDSGGGLTLVYSYGIWVPKEPKKKEINSTLGYSHLPTTSDYELIFNDI